ncbi:VOC family protein [Dyella soli]|uniref:Glyoxalase n=1 Tax=Dyella soli TaxID=522319 RepID=A0A4R0YRV9_9GAMM|nr:VOC family protein [Dyella soli]TCI09588.1 glyoxalase [Dyella soli]
MIHNRSMPPGTIIPELAYRDLPLAVAWLCRTFGFRERLRIGEHRAQLVFMDASIVVTQQDLATQPAAHAVMVHVPDIDSHYNRARDNGADIVRPPVDHPYGERQYAVVDIGGHRWIFSQSIADVDPEDWGGTLVDTSPHH